VIAKVSGYRLAEVIAARGRARGDRGRGAMDNRVPALSLTGIHPHGA
jgi:hypothetical protein